MTTQVQMIWQVKLNETGVEYNIIILYSNVVKMLFLLTECFTAIIL